MTLNLKISWPASTSGPDQSGYYLKAESVTHAIVRFAIQAPLPNTNTGIPADGIPMVYTIDLGMGREEYTVQGVIDSTGTGQNPSKYKLEEITRSWFDVGDEATALPLLSADTSNEYYGCIKSCDFRWEAAMEDRWQFTMTFLVRQKKVS